MAINENEKVARAEKLLKEALSDPETRRILQIKQRARLDRKIDLSLAFKEGKEKGETLGEAKGETKEKQKSAKKMLEKGFYINEISDITGLSKKEIENLK